MKPFNLQEALAGKPVTTRGGDKITRVIHVPESADGYQLTVVRAGRSPLQTADNGQYFGSNSTQQSYYDLFMASEKKEGWIGVGQTNKYSEKIALVTHAYATEQEARDQFIRDFGYTPAAVIKISWEE